MSWFERLERPHPEPLPLDATHESLLAAVVAAPEDDAPRWMLADWLEERNDPRGRFIALQLAAEHTVDRAPLDAEADALLEAHKAEWVGRFKGTRTEYGIEGGRTWVKRNPTHWTFRRGFVDRVKMALVDFVHNAQVLLDREPVTRVDLTQARGGGPLLAELPSLHRIRQLSLSRSKLVEDDLFALFGAAPASLERLLLDQCGIGMRRGSRVFAVPARLPALRTLSLQDNGLGDKGIAVLAANPILATVRELRVGYNKLGEGAVDALLASPHLEQLESLSVGLRVRGALRARLEARFHLI